MEQSTTTVITDMLLEESAAPQHLEITVWHNEEEYTTPFKVKVGCLELCFFDEDLKKIIKTLNAALRIRKEAISK